MIKNYEKRRRKNDERRKEKHHHQAVLRNVCVCAERDAKMRAKDK
jgi:hypothetical protein